MKEKYNSLMAFDYGLRQIGVAVGNTLLGTTQPLKVLAARDGVPNWEELEKLVTEWQPQLLIVGDPLNMDGTESELCLRARKFSRRLHGRLGLPIEMMDERLTSFEAKQLAKEEGHQGDYTAEPIDSLAAQLILESWFNRQNSSEP
ncbi:MAG: Holliday junction resolvase RuvX [Halioglobus sp.]